MAYIWQRWLADELRAAGLIVVEVAGWQNRGRPASTGHFQPRGLQTTHHSAATSSPSNPAAGLQTLILGRSDLPGPLCQTAIDYNGVVYVIAAGRANVNGRKRAVPNWPESDGNEQMGCEVITNGTQTMPAAQVLGIAVHNSAMLKHFGREPDGYLYRHEDISLTGKWDLGSRTTAQLRADVKALAINPPAPVQLEEDMLKIIYTTDGRGYAVSTSGATWVNLSEAYAVERITNHDGSDNDKVLQAEIDLYNAVTARIREGK